MSNDQEQVTAVAPNDEVKEVPAAELPAAPRPGVFLAWAVVPLGAEDLWELREIEIDGDKAKILRKGVPNTKAVCTARAIYGHEGFDPFDTGTVE